MNIDDAASHAERARAVKLAGVLIASLFQRAGDVVEFSENRTTRMRHVRQLASRAERKGNVHACVHGRQRAQERTRRGNDDDLLTRCKRMCRT